MQRLGLDSPRIVGYGGGVTVAIREKTEPVNMKIDPVIHRKLKIISAETGVPMRELVTIALEKFLLNGKK